MNLVDGFSRGDCGDNEARKTSALTNRSYKVDYLSFDHASHTVSNFVSNSAKNVSNYLTPDAKRAFDQLRQAFTEVPIFQHFDPEQYIQVELICQGMLLVKCWVKWPMTWVNGIWWPTSRVKWSLLKHDTKLITVSFWPFFRPSNPGGTTQKAENTRFLLSLTTITFDNLLIQRAWALARSAGLKSFLATIFGLIIVKEKQTELQTLYPVFLGEIMKKKPIFELKTLKSFIICSFYWQSHQFQVSTSRFRPFLLALGLHL